MPLHIGFVLFPNVQQLDLTGPYEVFASLPGTTMHLAAASLDPVNTATGLILTPTTTFETCPPLDVLCVPGGAGVNPLMEDKTALDFIRRQAAARAISARSAPAPWCWVRPACCTANAPPRIGPPCPSSPPSAPFRLLSVWCATVTCSPAAG